MILKVPVTGSGAEWVRRVAEAVNALITALSGVDGRVTTLETHTVSSITLTPGALPGSPVDGTTVLDSADGKVKTWYSGAWNAHY